MLTSGRIQVDRIIIDLRENTSPIQNIVDNIMQRINLGQDIKEVWGLMPDEKIKLIYP